MKRPSGFDREPEPSREPEREWASDPHAGNGAATGSGAESSREQSYGFASDAAARLLRRVSRGSEAAFRSESVARAEAAPGSETASRTEAADAPSAPVPADAPGTPVPADAPSAPVPPEAAPTIDLSDVRAFRSDSRRAGALERREGGAALAKWRSRPELDAVRAAERRVKAAARMRRARFRRERRRFSADAHRRRRAWLIVGAAVVGLAVFVAAGAFTPLMAVREVRITGVAAVSEADLKTALSRFDGMPLALVDDSEVHRALEPFPMIQRYAVERVPPHTMVVRIEERVPVISIAGKKRVSLYDAAGVLLGTAKNPPEGVPLGSGALTDLNSDAYRSASRALRDMPVELRAQVVGAAASSGQDVTFTLTSGVEVLWGDAEDTRRKAVVLQSMLASLGDREISRIDVSSFSAPVFQ
ncbi:cell division protein FtsQ/DivIB [Leucobacter sp. USHLN153]|uniref:cell division protein FtsQ/DivIB n=1 Tax=Leucobacter sp. USHLN153 TaxID=3081268 RepID=UPI00301A5EC1